MIALQQGELTRHCQKKSTGPEQTQHLKMITGKVTHHLLLLHHWKIGMNGSVLMLLQ